MSVGNEQYKMLRVRSYDVFILVVGVHVGERGAKESSGENRGGRGGGKREGGGRREERERIEREGGSRRGRGGN